MDKEARIRAAIREGRQAIERHLEVLERANEPELMRGYIGGIVNGAADYIARKHTSLDAVKMCDIAADPHVKNIKPKHGV